MEEARQPRRALVTYAREESFAPQTRIILGRLAYQVLTPEEWDEIPGSLERSPDLRIVDERRLAEVPGDDPVQVPIIVLTGRHGVTGADSRIVGAVKRPAGIHDLYRLLQQVFEDSPRATPRVPTHLQVMCRWNSREWRGALLSLSENGCLLRSPEPVSLGSEVELSFRLPRSGPIEVRAETAYQLVPDYGLVFSALAPAQREAIVSHVEGVLSGSAA